MKRSRLTYPTREIGAVKEEISIKKILRKCNRLPGGSFSLYIMPVALYRVVLLWKCVSNQRRWKYLISILPRRLCISSCIEFVSVARHFHCEIFAPYILNDFQTAGFEDRFLTLSLSSCLVASRNENIMPGDYLAFVLGLIPLYPGIARVSSIADLRWDFSPIREDCGTRWDSESAWPLSRCWLLLFVNLNMT